MCAFRDASQGNFAVVALEWCVSQRSEGRCVNFRPALPSEMYHNQMAVAEVVSESFPCMLVRPVM